MCGDELRSIAAMLLGNGRKGRIFDAAFLPHGGLLGGPNGDNCVAAERLTIVATSSPAVWAAQMPPPPRSCAAIQFVGGQDRHKLRRHKIVNQTRIQLTPGVNCIQVFGSLGESCSRLARKPPSAFSRQVENRLWWLGRITASAVILPPQSCSRQREHD